MREIVIDTETTGLDPNNGHRIIEIGAIELINKVRTGKFFHAYLNPQREVPIEAFNVHGLSTEFLKDKALFKSVKDEFLSFIKDASLIIHNAKFDLKFINYELSMLNANHRNLNNKIIDTLLLARKKFPGSPSSLDALCNRYKIDLSNRSKHGALVDTELLAKVYVELTGGSQNKLFDDSYNKQLLVSVDKKKLPRKIRNYLVSRQELESHQEFITKLKNPLWLS